MKADACISEMSIYLMNTIMSIGLLKLYLLLIYYPFSNVFVILLQMWHDSGTNLLLKELSDYLILVISH